MEELKDITLKLFNTETREKESISSGYKGFVSLYTCGPTIYDFAHIGNFRTYIFEDLLRRTLKFFNIKVTQVMNITDIDDKTIKGAIAQDKTLKEYTDPFKNAFFEDLDALNIQRAEFYPEATNYIEEMIQIILVLIEKGFAYVGADGSVYYSIEKFLTYGRLSHLQLDSLKKGASQRITGDEYNKENAADFVLWKSYDSQRDGKIYWESPFGLGRPGWHIECSAMGLKLLGQNIDIHCGGVDNIFPHHENEIAQSEAFTGTKFVNHWAHSEHLIVDNKKMSKSLGNFYTLRNLLEKGFTGQEVRYLLLQTHYRTQLNFTFQGLLAARQSLQRVADFIRRIKEIDEEKVFNLVLPLIKKAEIDFALSLADDLNISAALACIFDFIREANSLCDQKQIGKKEAMEVFEFFKKLNTVLGVLPLDGQVLDIPKEIIEALEKRDLARKQKNWAEADRLRDFIQLKGFLIEDTEAKGRVKKMGEN